jgi:hypothetical protein
MTDQINSRFAPTNLGTNFSSIYPEGDFQSDLLNPLNDQINKNKNKKNKINFSDDSTQFTDFTDNSSNFTNDISIKHNLKKNKHYDFTENLSEVSSNYSALSPELKKKIKSNSSHLKKYKDNDDENIMNHITKCDECKKQFANLFKNAMSETHLSKYDNSFSTTIYKDDNYLQIFGMEMIEFRNLLIILVIGIFIIIFVTIFMSK